MTALLSPARARWRTPARTILAKVLILGLWSMAALVATAAPLPLKVFILAGQSNMEGHAQVETFDYLGDDPATVPLLKRMRGADGKPTVCEGVWISYSTGHYDGSANGEGVGKLTGLRCPRRPAERRWRQDRTGIHLRPYSGRGVRRAGAPDQGCLGWEEFAHGLSPTERGPV